MVKHKTERWMQPSKKRSYSVWNGNKSKPVRLKSINVRNMFADSDRDGVPNVFDCQPRNPRKQDPIYYHGTSRKMARKIMREGLKPQSVVYTERGPPYAKKLSYVTSDKEMAKYRGGAGELKNGVVLKIDTPKEYPTEGEFIGISYGNPNTYAVEETIPPEEIEILEEVSEETKDED